MRSSETLLDSLLVSLNTIRVQPCREVLPVAHSVTVFVFEDVLTTPALVTEVFVRVILVKRHVSVGINSRYFAKHLLTKKEFVSPTIRAAKLEFSVFHGRVWCHLVRLFVSHFRSPFFSSVLGMRIPGVSPVS
jgi:hypothetical protein